MRLDESQRLERSRLLVVAVLLDQWLSLLQHGRQIRQRMSGLGVQRIGGREQPDDGEHDHADALLPVIGPMREAHARAGTDQYRAHPPHGCLLTRRLIQMRVVKRPARHEIQTAGEHESQHRREREPLQY